MNSLVSKIDGLEHISLEVASELIRELIQNHSNHYT